MKFLSALFTHARLVLTLRHNGAGMPKNLPAAAVLTLLYIALTLANKNLKDGIDLNTLVGLCFVAQFYLFGLRNEVMGLIILISIVNNALTLAATLLTGAPADEFVLLIIVEYVMIFAAVVNVIKAHAKIV
jgi:hypothetical protein